MLGAWALAFGCAVGSDAFVLPWTTFLPKAGPLGSILGIVVGSLAMVVIAWNYHYMINRHPGPGGVYTYAAEVFGHDHGFLCGYFLGFAYVAIVWLDVTAFVGLAQYLFGDIFHFGFHYNIEGREIYLGHILCALAAIAATTAICCYRRLSGGVQTAMALAFATGILACFAAAAFGHEGGVKTMGPAFSMSGGGVFSQVMGVLVIALWLFVGFESISNSSGEFRFPLQKSFKVMLAAIVTSVVAYALLTIIPVLVSGGWTGAVADIGDMSGSFAFDAAKGPLGWAGKIVVGLTLLGGIVTNLVGNTVAASRIAATMANDGAFPAWVGERNADGSPRNAVFVIALLAILVMPLGSTVIGIVVDVGIVGAAIAYGYTSAAAFRLARAAGDWRTQATGLVGTAISTATFALFLWPMFSSESAEIATGSYLVMIAWGLSGLAIFLTVFNRDTLRRFGRSSVVWTSLFMMILILSIIWMHQTTHDTTEKAYNDIVRYHAENCADERSGREARQGHQERRHDVNGWRFALRDNLSAVSRSIDRNSLVQGALNILALGLMFFLYNILRRRERDLEREKAKAKSYFFSTVSHDIRTPLNAIIGFSEMLKTGFKTEAEREQAIDAIRVSSRMLLGLINDILDLSKLESGKMEISPEPTDCSRLVRSVMDAFLASSGSPEVELRSSVEQMPLLMLDPQRLRQIAFNLIGNAVKFTEKGHVELRASFARTDGSGAGVFRLEVEDTGCGISEEDLKQLGSAYVQVGAKRSRNGGTGLGLAICRQLVAAMGGRLEIRSTLGAGSTFSIVIPGVKVSSGSAAENGTGGADETPAPAGGAQSRNESPRRVRRILVVDDSKMNCMVLAALLKQLGEFEVATVLSGREALELLDAAGPEPFDVVMTDMWMPDMDGGELVRAIRANSAHASLRVFVVTADVELREKSEEMGFDGILLKPVTAESLRRAVE
jgi:signal transduction histidine kinase/CheY-like chemotaxis protein